MENLASLAAAVIIICLVIGLYVALEQEQNKNK